MPRGRNKRRGEAPKLDALFFSPAHKQPAKKATLLEHFIRFSFDTSQARDKLQAPHPPITNQTKQREAQNSSLENRSNTSKTLRQVRALGGSATLVYSSIEDRRKEKKPNSATMLVTALKEASVTLVADSWKIIRKLPNFEEDAGEKLFRKYVVHITLYLFWKRLYQEGQGMVTF